MYINIRRIRRYEKEILFVVCMSIAVRECMCGYMTSFDLSKEMTLNESKIVYRRREISGDRNDIEGYL